MFIGAPFAVNLTELLAFAKSINPSQDKIYDVEEACSIKSPLVFYKSIFGKGLDSLKNFPSLVIVTVGLNDKYLLQLKNN